jgi:hypothetical protein
LQNKKNSGALVKNPLPHLMSTVKLRNSGPSHSMVMPMTNMVLSWRTAACLAQEGKSTFLDLVQYRRLSINIYELVPVDEETRFRLETVVDPQDLNVDVRSDTVRYLLLLVKAYVRPGASKTKKVDLRIYARQPYVDWMRFDRVVTSLQRSCRTVKSLKPATEVVEKSIKGNKRLEDFRGRTRTKKDFQKHLVCLLGIPRDLSLITPTDQGLSMYDKMVAIEGKPKSVVSEDMFDSMLFAELNDARFNGETETSVWYGKYLWYMLVVEQNDAERRELNSRIYKVIDNRKKIEEAQKKSNVLELTLPERQVADEMFSILSVFEDIEVPYKDDKTFNFLKELGDGSRPGAWVKKIKGAGGKRQAMYDTVDNEVNKMVRQKYSGSTTFFTDNVLVRGIDYVDRCIRSVYADTYTSINELTKALDTRKNDLIAALQGELDPSKVSNAVTQSIMRRRQLQETWKKAQADWERQLASDDVKAIKSARTASTTLNAIQKFRENDEKKFKESQAYVEQQAIQAERKKIADAYVNYQALRAEFSAARRYTDRGQKGYAKRLAAGTESWNTQRAKLPRDADGDIMRAIENFGSERESILEATQELTELASIKQRRAELEETYKRLQLTKEESDKENKSDRSYDILANLISLCNDSNLDTTNLYTRLLTVCEEEARTERAAQKRDEAKKRGEEEDSEDDVTYSLQRTLDKLRTKNPEKVASMLRRRNDITALVESKARVHPDILSSDLYNIGLDLAAAPALSTARMAEYFDSEIEYLLEPRAGPQTPVAQRQSPKAESPRRETPPGRLQTPPGRPQTPRAKTPKSLTPKANTPKSLTPKANTPKSLTPSLTPKANTPKSLTPVSSKSPKAPKALKAQEATFTFTTLPEPEEKPSDDVLDFFLKMDSKQAMNWDLLTAQAQLSIILPKIECLWDWMPQRADVISIGQRKYVWVLYTQLSTYKRDEPSVNTNVIWIKSQKQCLTEQNLYRRIAAASRAGPPILAAFGHIIKGTRQGTIVFDGFQTFVSQPPTALVKKPLEIKSKYDADLNCVLKPIAYLSYKDQPLAFDFESRVSLPDDVCRSGENTKNLKGWDVDPVPSSNCKQSVAAWKTYQELRTPDCGVSEYDTANMLKGTFPYASDTQINQIKYFVNKWEACDKPKIIFNVPKAKQIVGFKFLACGVFGCSSFWQSIRGGQEKLTNEVSKQMRIQTYLHRQLVTDPKTNDTTLQESKPSVWTTNVQHEYDMLTKLNKAGVSVAPLTKPKITGESLEILLVKEKVRYYPPVGEQYWTFSMQPAQITLQSYLLCNKLQTETQATNIATQIYTLFEKLRLNRLTHGDFHLANVMFLPDMKTLKLIDSGYASDLVFDHYYDLVAFTYACTVIIDYFTDNEKTKSANFLTFIRDDVYEKVKKDLEILDDTQVYEKGTTLENRNKFFNTFQRYCTGRQLQKDGLKWYQALRLPNKLKLDQAFRMSIIKGMVDGEKTVRFVYYQEKILDAVLAKAAASQ